MRRTWRGGRTASPSRALMLAWLVMCGLAVGTHGQESGQSVFVLSGQSNMVGSGVTAELPSELARTPRNVSYYLNGDPTRFTDQERFGPEVTFAHELAQVWPEHEIVLIKYAVGATSLLAWAPAWDSVTAARTNNASVGPLYENLLRIVASVPLREDAAFVGVLWMQGERDAAFPSAGAEYLVNFETLVSHLREHFGDPTLPFVFGHVNPPADRWTAADAVREAQREAEVRIPNTRLVSTAGLPKLDDAVHYDTEGQLELGRRFARAYLDLTAGARGR